MLKVATMFLALLLLVSAAIPAVAQDPFHDPGIKVDKPTATGVIAATEAWIKAVNAGDVAAVEATTEAFRTGYLYAGPDVESAYAAFQAQGIQRIKLLRAWNVRQLADGRLAVNVAYTGWYNPHWYTTERWFFVPGSGPYPYLFDDMAPDLDPAKRYVPKGWTTADVEVTIDAGGAYGFADGGQQARIGEADLLTIHMRTERSDSASFGLYRLPDDAEPEAGTVAGMPEYGYLFAVAGESVAWGLVALGPGTYLLVPVANGEPNPAAVPLVLEVLPRNATPASSPSA